tara:strand:+ start:742 stop:1023 length:282 start_codon:yes stop_codon:yes gene_type:complete
MTDGNIPRDIVIKAIAGVEVSRLNAIYGSGLMAKRKSPKDPLDARLENLLENIELQVYGSVLRDLYNTTEIERDEVKAYLENNCEPELLKLLV